MERKAQSVLIVDDNKDFCDSLFDCLDELDVDVNATHDPQTALFLAQSRDYDVALIDLKMPGMDGLTLFREMRQRHPRMRGILMTGFAEEETKTVAEARGFSAVLLKPVDFSQVVSMVTPGSSAT